VATGATAAAVFVRALDVNRRDVAEVTLGDLRHRHTASDDDYECCKHKFLHNQKPPDKVLQFYLFTCFHYFGHRTGNQNSLKAN
jgi:hypothetical protein